MPGYPSVAVDACRGDAQKCTVLEKFVWKIAEGKTPVDWPYDFRARHAQVWEGKAGEPAGLSALWVKSIKV